MKTTKLFVILDEATLETYKDESGEVAKFETEKEADQYAAERLEMWIAVSVHFNHKFINHSV